MQYINLFLSFFLILTGCFIFICSNPVYSTLFLILSFCNAAVILFLFEVEFLGLLFIMVYVGAVAVLFLFVIMMIDTKTVQSKMVYPRYVSLYLFFGILTFTQISSFINECFFNEHTFNNLFYNKNLALNFLENYNNIEVIGQALFNNYNVAILLAGFILLIALIGSICLTLDFKQINTVKQTDLKQLSRDFNSLNLFN